eukprot:2044965-Alexandrium_andersonii.AAC.1
MCIRDRTETEQEKRTTAQEAELRPRGGGGCRCTGGRSSQGPNCGCHGYRHVGRYVNKSLFRV